MNTKTIITEQVINQEPVAANGGEVGIVIPSLRGRTNTIYTINSASALSDVFGGKLTGDISRAYEYCEYLLSRGVTLKAVRVGWNHNESFSGSNKGIASLQIVQGNFNLTVQSVAEGADYNNVQVKITKTTAASEVLYIVEVYYGSEASPRERFSKVSFNVDSSYYYENTVNSNIIEFVTSGTYSDETNCSTSGKPSLSGGADGNIINLDYSSAINVMKDLEETINLLFIPGKYGQDAVELAKDLLDVRQDCTLFTDLLDPNSDSDKYTVNIAINERDAINNSRVTTGFPFVRVVGLPGRIPASLVLVEAQSRLNREGTPYKSPSGIENGRLTTVTGVGLTLSTKDIASLQDKNINPIIIKIGVGCVCWGNYVLTDDPTLITKLNTRNLQNYFVSTCRNIADSYMFRENSQSTWNQLVDEVSQIFEQFKDISISKYNVICDETIMSPEDISTGVLRCKVWYTPINSIEVMYFNFYVNESGVLFVEEE